MRIRKSLLLVVIMMVSMLFFVGCPKKAEVTTTPEAQKEEPKAPDQAAQQAEEAKRRAEEEARAKAEAEERERAAGLKPIYFDFDKSFIRDDARSVMKANADWLKANPKAKVKIEGNCDERGTIEYNQALGQRRAAAAKKYLTDLGISAKRISIISYGKEKPVCTASTEDCWEKNRRDDLVAQ